MKNWILGIVIASFCAMTSSCKDKKTESTTRADEKNVVAAADVPETVKTAFTAKYPNAAEIIWEDAHEGDDPTFKVKFKRDDKYWKAEFKADGSLVKEKEDE